MSVLCSHCGEELLGAVNVCWRCGKSPAPTTAIRPAADRPELPAGEVWAEVISSGQSDAGAHDTRSNSPAIGAAAKPAAYSGSTAAMGGAVGAVVLGGLSIIGAFISLGSLITAVLGLALGIWGLSCERRRVAVLGLTLCGIAIAVSAFSLVAIVFDSYTGDAPLDRTAPWQDYEGELDGRLPHSRGDELAVRLNVDQTASTGL